MKNQNHDHREHREPRSKISPVYSVTSVVKALPKNRTARASLHGPLGGLFGIDQEVVTLRGLFGNSGFCNQLPARPNAGIQSYSPVSVRAVVPGDRALRNPA
jgi:hypothetical protein